MMLDALRWFIAIEMIGLVAFPLAHYLFPRLPDRGYSLAKPLGLLIIAYSSWILSIYHIVPHGTLSILLIVSAMAVASLLYSRSNIEKLKSFLIVHKNTIIASEVIFATLFLAWILFRSLDPFINHTEQPMDIAFLNASIHTTFGPPNDPWFSGDQIRYYYFGYWIMSCLSHISGVTASIAYNLSLSLTAAMSGLAIFGLAYNIVRMEKVKWIISVISGLTAIIFMGFMANLASILEFMRHNNIGSTGLWNWIAIDGLGETLKVPATTWHPTEFWWWFRATRITNSFDDGIGVDYTIQEFPFFSFMLGDLHPHMMAIPFTLLVLAVCINLFQLPSFEWKKISLHQCLYIFTLGFLLGSLAFINIWDFPIYLAIVAVILSVKAYNLNKWHLQYLSANVLLIIAIVIIVAVLMYLPYFSSIRTSEISLAPVPIATRNVHFLIVWGFFLTTTIPFLLKTFWDTTIREDWRSLTITSILVAASPWLIYTLIATYQGASLITVIGRMIHTSPICILISIGVYNTLWISRSGLPKGRMHANVIITMGLILILGPELLYLRDSFDSRMNTVFKLHYQAWVLLALGSGFVLYYWNQARNYLTGWPRHLTTMWAAVFIVLFIGSIYYVPAALKSKISLPVEEATLDGQSFVKSAEYDAIQYLNLYSQAGDNIVEGVGEWSDWGLVSRSTGLPTILNWPGHELQWRPKESSLITREQDVARIYQTLDLYEATELLKKYKVRYVYIGNRERNKYGYEGEAKFNQFMDVAFSKDDVTIYKARW